MESNSQKNSQQAHIQQQDKLVKSSLKVIDKLGVLVKGNSKEADQKLTTLRKHAKKSSTLDEIQNSIDATADSLKDLDKLQSSKLTELKECLLVSGEALQSSKGMDDGIRRKLRMVVNKLKSQDQFVFNELQPQALALLGIFQSVKTEGNSSVKSAENNTKNSTTTDEFIDSKQVETFVKRMEKFSASNVIKPRLSEFNLRVKVARDNNEKFELCLKFFEEVLNHFSEEYQQTQKLIVNINLALEEVHKTLINSLSSSKDYSAQLAALNLKIDKQIEELSTETEKAESVESLKELIDKKLTVINESIKQRDDVEKKRTMELDATLQNMESKLGKLEKRTEYYRQKWLEEKHKSDTDSLTGLPNRGAYDKRLEEEFKRWLRRPEPMCIAVLDIDHFKKINDQYGHRVGDKTLQIVAQTMRKTLRATDYLARYGGEEFVCLLLNTDAKEVMTPLEKVRKAIENIPFKIKNERLNITISIGVTMLLATDNSHTVFDRADKALYEAKDTGRNKICYKK